MDPTDLNDPNPVAIAVYAFGFAAAFVLNLYALWRLVRMDHVRRERSMRDEAPPDPPYAG